MGVNAACSRRYNRQSSRPRSSLLRVRSGARTKGRSADSNQYAPQLSQSKPLRAFVSSIRIELPSLHSRARNSRNRPMPLPPWLHPPHLLRHPQTRDVKRAVIEICKRRPPGVGGWSGKGGPDSIEERRDATSAATGGKEPMGLILRYSPFPLCSTLHCRISSRSHSTSNYLALHARRRPTPRLGRRSASGLPPNHSRSRNREPSPPVISRRHRPRRQNRPQRRAPQLPACRSRPRL